MPGQPDHEFSAEAMGAHSAEYLRNGDGPVAGWQVIVVVAMIVVNVGHAGARRERIDGNLELPGHIGVPDVQAQSHVRGFQRS